MKVLQIEALSHNVGAKKLFDQIDFTITSKQKVGLVGVNGTGKSTFLDIVAGRIEADRAIITHPQDYYIGYLRQDSVFDPQASALDTVFEGQTPIMQTVRNYEAALQALGKNRKDPEVQRAFTRAEDRMNKESAWSANAEAKMILAKLGITDMSAQMSHLSGGQVKRVMLAQVLIQAPDLLILDEPTNHLDYQMIEWLEAYLSNYKSAVLLVSHDRYFLNRSVDTIMEFRHQKLYTYLGNYEKYVQKRAEEESLRADQAHKEKQLYKQELAWMREGVRARGSKQKSRVNRFKELEKSAKSSQNDLNLSIDFAQKKLGQKVIEFEDASLHLSGQKILENFNLLVQNHARIGITGENGSGKSSLLNVMAGKLELDEGQVILGETVKIGYYTQDSIELDPDDRVISFLQKIAQQIRLADGRQVSVSQLLEAFLFPKASLGALISSLSGGERKRLYLLSILMQEPNVLLLDEPTNDLDIETLTILEDYLSSFQGAVLTISHDRYFLDKVVDQLLIFKGQADIEFYTGSMSDYLKTRASEEKNSKKSQVKNRGDKQVKREVQAKKKQEKIRLNYHEQQEWKTIEDELFSMDERLSEIADEMAAFGHDLAKLQELDQERIDLERQLEEKMNRWEYLSRFVSE